VKEPDAKETSTERPTTDRKFSSSLTSTANARGSNVVPESANCPKSSQAVRCTKNATNTLMDDWKSIPSTSLLGVYDILSFEITDELEVLKRE
jgi:hypothetical protein